MIAKRLLGLSYCWSSAQNAVELQVGATWLLYAVLIDLTDAVAEALHRPFSAISVERVSAAFTMPPVPANAERRLP